MVLARVYSVSQGFHIAVLACSSLMLACVVHSIYVSEASCDALERVDWATGVFSAVNVLQWSAIVLVTLFLFPLRVEVDEEKCELRYVLLGFTVRLPLAAVARGHAAAGGLARRLLPRGLTTDLQGVGAATVRPHKKTS
ncbi:unnamed protein product, partial [Prorocentrum cordatum]